MIVVKEDEYVINHCSKYLNRDVVEARHNFLNSDSSPERASVAEAWRFPVVDAHDGVEAATGRWNDVTFVFARPRDSATPSAVALVGTCHVTYEPLSLAPVGDSRFLALTLRLPRGRSFRYKFLVDGELQLDPINPQTVRLPDGDIWSTFFTWAHPQPLAFERWELAILDRLTRHILPFNDDEARVFLERSVNEADTGPLYRLDVPVGVANYIDKVVTREERHRLYAYKTCLEFIDTVLRRRFPYKDPEFLDERAFRELYADMAGAPERLFADGWDSARYGDPTFFLRLLRRHAWTGAFAHPKWGGNPGGMAWAYLAERFRTSDDPAPTTAFDWRRAIEPPLGASSEYRG